VQKSEGAKVWELWRPQKEASVAGRGGQWENRRSASPPSPGWSPGVNTSQKAVIISHLQVNEGELGGNVIFVDS